MDRIQNMISMKSLFLFFYINGILSTIGGIEYRWICFFYNSNLFYIFCFLAFLSKNYTILYWIDYDTKTITDIHSIKRHYPKESYLGEFHGHVVVSSILETSTFWMIQSHLSSNIVFQYSDILFFIPISFFYELIFDFFHYWSHRMMHQRFFYKYIHKTHHKFIHPISILTYYHSPLDILFTENIPTILTMYCIPSLSIFQYTLISVYKTYMDIQGHIGKNTKSSSFTQCIWLPRLLQIELYPRNHDYHHSKNKSNYATRFSIWDKVFGTYVDY